MPTLITIIVFVLFILFSYFTGNGLLNTIDDDFATQFANTFFGMLIVILIIFMFWFIYELATYFYINTQTLQINT